MPKSSQPETSLGVAAGVDRQLVASAYTKVMRGETPTTREQNALTKFEKQREEKLRWTYYATIPKKHWRKMSGRQNKVIDEQAQRYGLPFGGRVVDLPAVVRALHDFLAENARRLTRDEEMLTTGPMSPALERYREERAAIARLDRLEREGVLLAREDVHTGLMMIAGILRSAGETLRRGFGPEAAAIIEEALDDAEVEIRQQFGSPENASGSKEAALGNT